MGEEVVGTGRVYDAVRSGIRDTDEISFKLLGLVPLVSGVGLVTVVLGDSKPSPAMIVVLALFSSVVTLGFFYWELRNVQTCVWLVDYAKALEQKALAEAGLPVGLAERPKAHHGMGKRTAEKIVYSTTIVTWLAVPFAMHALSGKLLLAYIAMSFGVAYFTWKAAKAPSKITAVDAAV